MTDFGDAGTDGADGGPSRPGRGGGRPRASSRRTLEDAASELFLEQGYAQTTIEHITQRAGVGRNTFFNYFSAKSDLLWLDVDETLSALPSILDDAPVGLPPSEALAQVLGDLAARHPHRSVPIALSQREPMATHDEFLSAGLGRFLRVAHELAGFLAARAPGVDDGLVRAAANAATAAAATGAGTWALAGVERGDLSAEVLRAVAPVCRGFAPVLDPAGP
ncbi:TetR/AcrR family transcriptional regulator [Agromyces salentinus]|uniref:HTH tetR-type domain-containing protein n=1 Tax=Agromyces salentinus TaxID=269421 RepID=A0ABN2MXH9_9MICO|nr:TetR/AcrR family transcriptional regulator [Agromyces salentinus]